ncbi:hypothetical protein L208DRAFT_1284200 [Tricholoma matsutake]|nr:hypothetical protein L208DRAFT_1284200 [Tricholoma matsutake 945]
MTDYLSQGKTRPYNVVNLNENCSHQSYYTALSRGTSATGTLITQPFHPQKTTGGASGALRQEFRELELFDEITDLLYNGKLHKSVIGEQRNMPIASFRLWKGLHYVPHAVHKAIRWNSRDPLLEPEVIDVRWRIIEKQTKNALQVSTTTNAASSVKAYPHSTRISLKRKISDVSVSNTTGNEVYYISVPLGIIWSNNSCAYDSVFSILYAVWKTTKPEYWSHNFGSINDDILEDICNGFQSHLDGLTSLEHVRDIFRHGL